MSLPLRDFEIPQKKIYTYADYALLPEGAPYQLIGGKLIMTPAPAIYHQIVSMRLVESILKFNAQRNVGIVLYAPVDVYLEEKETYQPDIIFIAKDRLHIIGTARVNGAPDLVAEILSPSTAYYDLRGKFRAYAKYGVREYWIVDPDDKSVEIYEGKEGRFEQTRRVEGEGKAFSGVLEGFVVEIKDVFAGLGKEQQV